MVGMKSRVMRHLDINNNVIPFLPNLRTGSFSLESGRTVTITYDTDNVHMIGTLIEFDNEVKVDRTAIIELGWSIYDLKQLEEPTFEELRISKKPGLGNLWLYLFAFVSLIIPILILRLNKKIEQLTKSETAYAPYIENAVQPHHSFQCHPT